MRTFLSIGDKFSAHLAPTSSANTVPEDQKSEPNSESSVPIRAISRGLAVLKTINRLGSASLIEISREAQVPYPTACRIVNTLLHEDMIEREPNRRRYRPTFLVQSLSVGYIQENQLVTVANKHIIDLCSRVVWPISLATRVGASMVLRDSTHYMTSLTLSHYYPGYTLPITECSTGKVFLAFCDPVKRANILKSAALDSAQNEMANWALDLDESYWNEIREKGFAVQINNKYSANPGKTSSIAVPIISSDEIVGAMAVIYFKTSMTPQQAENKFADTLKETSEKISAALPQTKD